MSKPIQFATEVIDEERSSTPTTRYVPKGAALRNEHSPPLPPSAPREIDNDDLLDLEGEGDAQFKDAKLTRVETAGAATAEELDDAAAGEFAMDADFDEDDEKTASAEDMSGLWTIVKKYLPKTPEAVMDQIASHIEFSLARSRWNFDSFSLYQATALSVRDRLIEYWNDTQEHFTDEKVKRTYYLSIEYLMGRYLRNAIMNTRLKNNYTTALNKLGARLEDLYDEEQDAALGSGGLGRLAACFLDSLATTNLPAWGYGIRYEFGMFKQNIVGGQQAEVPEYWLEKGNPWEICRRDVNYKITFGGYVTDVLKDGKVLHKWEGGHTVIAIAYDTPVPGYNTHNTINLRLWSAQPATVFDLDQFNREDQHPDYWATLNQRQKDDNITKVLYPKTTPKGQELRLKQQYFFCCATLQDIIRRFKKMGKPLTEFPEYVAIQLNDTHPTIAVPELMRILVDLEGLEWDAAWDICTKTFAYTNHTILPEALETWPVSMFQYLLPRHLQIIYDINQQFLDKVRAMRKPGSDERLYDDNQIARMSIIEEGGEKRIRMANLAIIGSHKVNGVAALHSQILKDHVFNDFNNLWPTKFINITNGVTPRRWIDQCNPYLSTLITQTLHSNSWITNLDKLQGLTDNITPELIAGFRKAKLMNKMIMRKRILKIFDGKIDVDPEAMFDVQVKRIHEYKRQLLNILGVIHRYLTILALPPEKRTREYVVPKVVIFAGKAAAGYEAAKLVIRLICAVSEVINNDPNINGLLKVVFIPNYSVSRAENIIPASDLSQHISTAGTEASGTSNMKFVMNGGLIIGTLDGANVEIMERCGKDNIFIFGAVTEDVAKIRSSAPRCIDERLYNVLKAIQEGRFGYGEQFYPLIDPLWRGNDYYAVAYDFPLYIDKLAEVDEAWRNPEEWTVRTIRCVARTGFFSSDRTIRQYADEIWNIKPCPLTPSDKSSK